MEMEEMSKGGPRSSWIRLADLVKNDGESKVPVENKQDSYGALPRSNEKSCTSCGCFMIFLRAFRQKLIGWTWRRTRRQHAPLWLYFKVQEVLLRCFQSLSILWSEITTTQSSQVI
jgi:hypothetical protein